METTEVFMNAIIAKRYAVNGVVVHKNTLRYV